MADIALTPTIIGEQAARRLADAFARPTPRISFVPNGTKRRNYMARDLDAAVRSASPGDIEFIADGRVASGDIVITTCHADDVSAPIWALRAQVVGCIVVVWFWDNHHHPLVNLRSATAADIAIPAHHSFRDELANPLAILAPTVPLGCTQWSRAEAAQLFARLESTPRGDALSGGFVRYDWAPRQAILDRLIEAIPGCAIRLVPHDQQGEFFALTPEARLRSWMEHKVSIVLPVNRDLPLRLFDALLAGQTVIVPSDLSDLDRLVPRERQRELGIVRFASPDTEAILAAWREALHLFDAGGDAGIRRRHAFVRDGHMLENRLTAITEVLRGIANGGLPVRFGRSDSGPFGLLAEMR